MGGRDQCIVRVLNFASVTVCRDYGSSRARYFIRNVQLEAQRIVAVIHVQAHTHSRDSDLAIYCYPCVTPVTSITALHLISYRCHDAYYVVGTFVNATIPHEDNFHLLSNVEHINELFGPWSPVSHGRWVGVSNRTVSDPHVPFDSPASCTYPSLESLICSHLLLADPSCSSCPWFTNLGHPVGVHECQSQYPTDQCPIYTLRPQYDSF